MNAEAIKQALRQVPGTFVASAREWWTHGKLALAIAAGFIVVCVLLSIAGMD